MHSVTGSRTVDAFPILRSCRRRFSPSTSLILSIGCSRACGPSNCPFGCLGTLAPAGTELHLMNCRKETAATCRVIRSNASPNRRSISIELCPAAVPAVDGIVPGSRCVRAVEGHAARWRRQHLPGSARSKGRRHRLARGGARARATSDPANCRYAATPAGRTPGAGNGSPAGPIQNRFECSIVDPTVIALLGRAAAALVAWQRGAILADCPHLHRPENGG